MVQHAVLLDTVSAGNSRFDGNIPGVSAIWGYKM